MARMTDESATPGVAVPRRGGFGRLVGRGAADGEVELWDRRTGDRQVVPAAEAVARLTA